MNDCDKSIYDLHCKEEFSEIRKQLSAINKKLFQDNGDLSMQTKIDRNTQFVKRLATVGAAIWAVAIIVVSVLIRKFIG